MSNLQDFLLWTQFVENLWIEYKNYWIKYFSTEKKDEHLPF